MDINATFTASGTEEVNARFDANENALNANFETAVIYAKEPYNEVANEKGTTIIIGG